MIQQPVFFEKSRPSFILKPHCQRLIFQADYERSSSKEVLNEIDQVLTKLNELTQLFTNLKKECLSKKCCINKENVRPHIPERNFSTSSRLDGSKPIFDRFAAPLSHMKSRMHRIVKALTEFQRTFVPGNKDKNKRTTVTITGLAARTTTSESNDSFNDKIIELKFNQSFSSHSSHITSTFIQGGSLNNSENEADLENFFEDISPINKTNTNCSFAKDSYSFGNKLVKYRKNACQIFVKVDESLISHKNTFSQSKTNLKQCEPENLEDGLTTDFSIDFEINSTEINKHENDDSIRQKNIMILSGIDD